MCTPKYVSSYFVKAHLTLLLSRCIASYILNIQVYWGYSICALLSIAMISGFEPFWKLKSGFIPQLLVILIFDFSPTLYMMVGGANLAPERSYAMHLGHLTSYVCWQTNVFIWNFRGPNKHWMSNYGGGDKSVKAA